METIKVIINYLLQARPASFAVYGYPFLVSAGALLIFGLGARLFLSKIKPPYRRLVKRAKTYSLYYATISLLFLFLRWQRVPYLSMRLWLWLWVAGFAVLAILMVVKEIKRVPLKQAEQSLKLKQKRYFAS